jgi:type I restriction enzyme M protein
MSQVDLALKLGTNQSYVSQWENGGRTPGGSDMKVMEELFGGPAPAGERPAQGMLPFAQEKPPAAKPAAPELFPGGVVVEKVSAEEFAALSGGKPGRLRVSSTPAVPSAPAVPGQSTVTAQSSVPTQPIAPKQPAPPAQPVVPARPAAALPASPPNHVRKPDPPAPTSYHFSEKVSFIWSVADLLRGDYKQSEYGKVILPFTVLRRLDQVLDSTRNVVRDTVEKYGSSPTEVRHQMVLRASGRGFYNTSKLDFAGLLGDPNHIASNLAGYIAGFSVNARDILDHFRFDTQIERLDKANLLYLVVQKFAAFDLHPDRVTNHEMGTIFEELIRKFAEASNETAGEHFTPREVIRLMVNLLFAEDDDALRKPGIVRTMYDPACGTGGMLSVAEEHLRGMNSGARLEVFGQELNDESYAICKADMLIKGQDADSIKKGNSFSEDGLPDLRADYLISNPPFGVDWTKAENVVRGEHETRGYAGRFGPGLPRKNDGSLLFLLHMWSKRKPPEQGGSRLAIVFNGSPLFTGAAGSGESEIRRWIINNDWLEAIVALPDQMFYNTGISTYVWLLSNRKAKYRKGKVQLINGVSRFQKMRKSLGDKRKELSEDGIVHLTRLYHAFEEGEECRIFNNDDFGYRRVTVERPLKLNFQASPKRIARLDSESAWSKLVASSKKDPAAQTAEMAEGKQTQEEVLGVLSALAPSKVYRDREDFLTDLKAAARKKGVKLAAPLLKAVLSALSERDETAEVCRDASGDTEPDSDLRDNENVPLSEDIDAYMAREVLPHVPDAWVDKDSTKIGYEIPFTRHFYVYQPPRPLEVIEKEIRDLEGEIRGMLEEVLG